MTFDPRDLKLIGSTFMFGELPKDKQFLGNYFSEIKTPAPWGAKVNDEDDELVLVSYYCQFPDLLKDKGIMAFRKFFNEHTGRRFMVKRIKRILKKVTDLEDAIRRASESMDLELLAQLKTNQIPK